jgi:hypothetical protein
MLPSGMGQHNNQPPLSDVQQCVVNALAAGATLSAAAESFGVHRVTVYRWIKNYKPFAAALSNARADFVLASRDKLYHLSVRALDTLLAVLENPKSSPAVLLRTAMFVLQRPQLPKVGWAMPEPVPDPDGKKLLDSAIIEQDYASLPGLYNIERDEPPEPPPETPGGPPTGTPAGTEEPAESATSEPTPPASAAECNRMQHDPPDSEAPAPHPAIPPHPPVALSRLKHRLRHYLRQWTARADKLMWSQYRLLWPSCGTPGALP